MKTSLLNCLVVVFLGTNKEVLQERWMKRNRLTEIRRDQKSKFPSNINYGGIYF